MLATKELLARSTSVLVLLGAAAAPAWAATVAEIEPNNSLAAAQMVVNTDSLLRINGARSFTDPSDDFFAFMVPASGLLQISSASPDAFADSIMGLYNASGALVASNDDAAGTFMSAISYTVSPADVGLFRIGFSGFNPGLLACTETVLACYDTNGDFVFDTFVAGGGSGGSTGWTYAINVSGAAMVPEPGAFALMALGLPLLLLLGRREGKRPR